MSWTTGKPSRAASAARAPRAAHRCSTFTSSSSNFKSSTSGFDSMSSPASAREGHTQGLHSVGHRQPSLAGASPARHRRRYVLVLERRTPPQHLLIVDHGQPCLGNASPARHRRRYALALVCRTLMHCCSNLCMSLELRFRLRLFTGLRRTQSLNSVCEDASSLSNADLACCSRRKCTHLPACHSPPRRCSRHHPPVSLLLILSRKSSLTASRRCCLYLGCSCDLHIHGLELAPLALRTPSGRLCSQHTLSLARALLCTPSCCMSLRSQSTRLCCTPVFLARGHLLPRPLRTHHHCAAVLRLVVHGHCVPRPLRSRRHRAAGLCIFLLAPALLHAPRSPSLSSTRLRCAAPSLRSALRRASVLRPHHQVAVFHRRRLFHSRRLTPGARPCRATGVRAEGGAGAADFCHGRGGILNRGKEPPPGEDAPPRVQSGPGETLAARFQTEGGEGRRGGRRILVGELRPMVLCFRPPPLPLLQAAAAYAHRFARLRADSGREDACASRERRLEESAAASSGWTSDSSPRVQSGRKGPAPPNLDRRRALEMSRPPGSWGILAPPTWVLPPPREERSGEDRIRAGAFWEFPGKTLDS
ncbi:unnamed protein product [Urochloa humidicola]